jgi:RHS repeat-associated protein
LFTGRRVDILDNGSLKIQYNRNRYYAPDIGRFLQTDPIRYAAGLNLYTYCGNNPLNWVDSWGLSKIWPWPKEWRWYHYPIALIHGTFEITARPTEMILDLPSRFRETWRLGEKRKRAFEKMLEGGPFPKTVDPIAGEFDDWRRRTTKDALSIPGTSLTGPIFSPTRPVDFVIPIVESTLKDCPPRERR